MIFHADQEVEILDALELARELKVKAVISGGAEAWKVVDALQKAKVPVLVGGTLRLPRKEHDPYDSAYATPAKLHAAGVTFAIKSQSGGPGSATATRNLPYEAAAAVAFGLPEDAALRVRHPVTGPDPRRRRSGRVDRGGQAGQPRRHRRAISSSRRRPCWSSSSTASRCRPRAGTPSSTPSTGRRLDEVRAGRAGWGSSRRRAGRSAVARRRKPGRPARNDRSAAGAGTEARPDSAKRGRAGAREARGGPISECLSRQTTCAVTLGVAEDHGFDDCAGSSAEIGRARSGGRRRAKIRIQDPAELIDVMSPADVLTDPHAIQRGGLIDPISIGDDQDGDLARQDAKSPRGAD